MFAKHPKTGKDIRIMTMDTSVWRDQKTLVWFDEVPAAAAWNRWDVGTTSTATAEKLLAAGIQLDVVVCLDEGAQAWLEAGRWTTSRLVVVPRSLVTSMGMDKLLELQMNNLLCVDEMHELYPFTGAAWDGTAEDAKALVALVLHFGRSFPVASERTAFAALRGLKLQTTVEQPKKLWLVTQYYRPDSGKRRTEIDACLKKNLECEVIDRVVLLNEKANAPPHPKILEKVVGKRLTYAALIRWIYDEAPVDTIVAFANADIFLDAASWRLLWSTDLDTQAKFLALLRWDVGDVTVEGIKAAELFGPRADSQDTWVVSAAAVKAVQWDWAALDFPLGQGGCDNAITLEMFKKRFLVANPALTLKTYHYHASRLRTYDPRDIVEKPAYLYIQPTGLHDMRPVMDLGKPARIVTHKPLRRRIKGPLSEAQARTFCTMVKRTTENKVELDPVGDNLWTPAPVGLHEMKEVFQTRDGLVYSYDSLFVGKTKASAAAWADSQLSSMAASLPVEHAVIAPLPDAVAKDPGQYVLQYLSKVLLMRKGEFAKSSANDLSQTPAQGAGEFWCPKTKGFIEAVQQFRWPTREVPVLSRDENLQTWCKTATVWPYQDSVGGIPTSEEIGALRQALKNWGPTVEGKKLVLVMDEAWVTDELAETFEKLFEVKLLWPGKTSLDICIDAMRGAWGLILATNELAPWTWVLPEGARIWEIQSEMKPSADQLHLSAAADLDHRLVIVAKGVPNKREKDAVLKKILGDMNLAEEPVKPLLIMPAAQQGFYGHAGDSFRETAKLWAAKGYVTIEERPVSQVWLGAVGETLLYDRPTLQWLQQAPKAESLWKHALFGNPEPPAGGKSWSFWPRRPELVEELVAAGLPAKSFEAREKGLVFYGRSENAVQRERRTKAEWAEACDDFSHRVSVDKYLYTQREYLELLANAKFGLCLAGYGYKCHREIECMAMGCVPVVAPEVDMTNYADPPVEGLHYFRVETPEEAKAVLATTAERWMVMSAACRDWWQRNASAEGMWELTQRLIKN